MGILRQGSLGVQQEAPGHDVATILRRPKWASGLMIMHWFSTSTAVTTASRQMRCMYQTPQHSPFQGKVPSNSCSWLRHPQIQKHTVFSSTLIPVLWLPSMSPSHTAQRCCRQLPGVCDVPQGLSNATCTGGAYTLAASMVICKMVSGCHRRVHRQATVQVKYMEDGLWRPRYSA